MIEPNVLIGTPVCRSGAYALDKFLTNQKQIQQNYPGSSLVMATSEPDFVDELENLIQNRGLRGTVILHHTTRPDYAKSDIWDITCGRESIKVYMLSQTTAQRLLFLDADMTYEARVIRIMDKESPGYDAVFSGCPLKNKGTGLAGAGCLFLTRSVLERVKFRCREFRNGDVIFEDNLLELDLFRLGCRVKKGFFLSIAHYRNAIEAQLVNPKHLSVFRRTVNAPFVRYFLITASVLIQRNIPWRLKTLFTGTQG